jgi:hypothetical protein
MAYTPATPYPKGRGDAIRSADWNEAVNELLRLENEKFNRAGGTVTGNLTVNGTISGTLANNIVTNTKIADNSVTNTKLAGGSVTSDKIAAGAISGDHLPNNKLSIAKLEGFLMADMTFTLPATATHGFNIATETITAGSRGYEIFVFAYSPTSGCYFSYEPRVWTSGTQLNRWLHFTNHNTIATEVRMKVYGILAPA